MDQGKLLEKKIAKNFQDWYVKELKKLIERSLVYKEE